MGENKEFAVLIQTMEPPCYFITFISIGGTQAISSYFCAVNRGTISLTWDIVPDGNLSGHYISVYKVIAVRAMMIIVLLAKKKKKTFHDSSDNLTCTLLIYPPLP